MDDLAVFAMFIFPLVVIALIPVLVIWGVMWLAGRYLGQRIAIGVAIICIGLLAWTSVDMNRGCNVEPTWVPDPQSEEGVRPEFACDGPGGFGAYIIADIVVPIGILLLGFAAYRSWRKLKGAEAIKS